MTSKHVFESGKVFVPLDFKQTMQSLLDTMTRPLTRTKRMNPIMTTFTTSDERKTTIDLNICRPLHSSRHQKISKNKEEQEENMEDLIIVWLDQNINETEKEFPIRRTHLRQAINYLKPFDNAEECVNYIKTITQEKIFLIMSGILGKTIMDEINKYSQVIFVYIYCSHEDEHKSWTKNYRKIVGIFTTEHELITQITIDVSSFFHNNLPVSVINSIDTSEKSLQDVTNDQAQFMWSQILLEILLELPQTSMSKQELIKECRRQYKYNSYQQNKITEFEKNYISSNALAWYTRDSFLYRIVNKALRTQNILYIFRCRFFITDLFQQLTKFHLKLRNSSEKKILTVYRGQLMAADEFFNLQKNINGFISINTFFSTSSSSEVVFPFTGNGSRRPQYESLFFEIELNLNSNTIPFVQVSNESKFKSEEEILICMGAIFRIEFIDKLTDVIWHVKLISTDTNDNTKLDDLTGYLKKESEETPICLALGRMLQKIGEYDKAQAFYQMLLTELPAAHEDLAGVYNDLGIALFKTQKNSKLVLSYLIQSLTLQMKTFPKRFLFFTQTLSNIASVYTQRRKFKVALNFLQITLNMLDWDRSTNTSRIILSQRSEVYNNIGNIYSHLGQLSFSMKYFKISLEIGREILPPNHPDVASILNNIGMIYLQKLNYAKADQYFQQANIILQESLPFERHPDIAQLYNNIGLLEYERENPDKALSYYDKALEIQLKCLPPIHWKTGALYNNIGHIYFDKADYQMALKMYQKALEIGHQCLPSIHLEISHAYRNVGRTYRCLNDYPNALINCITALQIGLKCLPSTHSYLAEAYRALAQVYDDIANYSMAMKNFQKALDIFIKKPPINKMHLATLYKDIGFGYYNTEHYQSSLKNLRKALEIFRTCSEDGVDKHITNTKELITQIIAMEPL